MSEATPPVGLPATPSPVAAGDLTRPDTMRAAVQALGVSASWTGPFDEVCRRLADVAQLDVALARLVEGHADAVRILTQAGTTPREGGYGVWASRSAGTGLRATPAADHDGWCLDGELRFASGIDVIDRVLVPGWVDDDTHLLFDVAAHAFEADRDSWHTAAMAGSRSFTVHAVGVRAGDPVGDENFYLSRPGFAVGGLGVAAVWAGAAASLTEQTAAGLRRFAPSPHQLRRLGVMQQASWQADTLVTRVAATLDPDDREATAREVAAARTAAVTACESVIDEAGRIVGPGGLSGDGRLARTLVDLGIYIRQHHLDLTLQALGRTVLDQGTP